MDKQEYITELDQKIDILERLLVRTKGRKDKLEAKRLEGKIEGIKLARDFASEWLGEDI